MGVAVEEETTSANAPNPIKAGLDVDDDADPDPDDGDAKLPKLGIPPVLFKRPFRFSFPILLQPFILTQHLVLQLTLFQTETLLVAS